MKLGRSKLARIITDRSLDSSVSSKQLSQEIAAYLLTEGRIGELDSLMRDVMDQRAQAGIVEVEARSSHELSPAERKSIEDIVRTQYPEAKTIQVVQTLDPHVLGGLTLSFAHEQLDMSVRAKINRFKQLTTATGGQ